MPKGFRYTDKTFKEKVKSIAGDNFIFFGKFVNVRTHMNCFCSKCKITFRISPMKFLDGRRCPDCYYNSLRLTDDEVQQRLDSKYPGEFKLSSAFRGVDYKTDITHLICGRIFNIQPNNIMSNGQYCPNCISKVSYGEMAVKKFLDDNSIKYEMNKRFPSCKNIQQLPFDFFLPELNICIEYDGEHHFKPVSKFGGQSKLESVQENDNIKNIFCKDNSIDLIRIPYKEKKNINNILDKLIKQRSTTIPAAGVGSSDPKQESSQVDEDIV